MEELTNILAEWPYDPHACIRKVKLDEKREVMQVRTPMGIEQYELIGRPDGLRPKGHESLLEYVEARLARHKLNGGSERSFRINPDMAIQLQNEGTLYYFRYLICFQVGEHQVVILDTRRNLRMFDLIERFCVDEEIVYQSTQYRPYVMRLLASSLALDAIARSDYGAARKVLTLAIGRITNLQRVPTKTFDFEKRRALSILRGMKKAVPSTKKLTVEQKLVREMKSAVAEEDYERAANIRDQLKKMHGIEAEDHSASRSSPSAE